MYYYKEKKKKKLASLKKEGKHFLLTVVRYDQNTGEKKAPIVFRLEKNNVKERKAEFEKQADDLAEILKDMNILEKESKNED